MRGRGLIVVLCGSLGCYVGPSSSGDTDDRTSGPGSTDDPSGASGPPPTTPPPTTTTSATTDEDTDGGSSDDGPAGTGTDDGPSDSSGESTGGEMSGCEGGPLPAPIPGCAPTPPPSTGDIHQDCVDRINQFRWECQCLPPLARWTEAESCTDQQSADDQNGGGPHGNFGACGENAQNTCPNWGSEQQVISGCLQAMWDEGPGEPFSEHGHYINMSNPAYSRVACGFSSAGGGVWSNQNFSP